MPYVVDWDWGVTTLFDGIENFESKTRERIEEVCLEWAVKAVEYMKANAPWQDQTGYARDGLDTRVETKDGTIEIDLFHGVDYGIWLEIRWGGTYAIILPTIEVMGPQLMQDFQGILDDIEYP